MTASETEVILGSVMVEQRNSGILPDMSRRLPACEYADKDVRWTSHAGSVSYEAEPQSYLVIPLQSPQPDTLRKKSENQRRNF